MATKGAAAVSSPNWRRFSAKLAWPRVHPGVPRPHALRVRYRGAATTSRPQANSKITASTARLSLEDRLDGAVALGAARSPSSRSIAEAFFLLTGGLTKSCVLVCLAQWRLQCGRLRSTSRKNCSSSPSVGTYRTLALNMHLQRVVNARTIICMSGCGENWPVACGLSFLKLLKASH
jgi:hypothetical protein